MFDVASAQHANSISLNSLKLRYITSTSSNLFKRCVSIIDD